MLASIEGWRLAEWQIFDELDPPYEERADWNAAHVVQAVMRNGKPLDEFKLPFGDVPVIAPVVQSLEYQEMVIDAWCQASNAVVKRG